MWAILSKYFCPLFTPIFNPIWRDCVWRERRENLWTLAISFMFSSTKQLKVSFSFQFYFIHFPSSLKSLQPNIVLNLFTCVTFKINNFILFIVFILLLYTIDVVKSIINLILKVNIYLLVIVKTIG